MLELRLSPGTETAEHGLGVRQVAANRIRRKSPGLGKVFFIASEHITQAPLQISWFLSIQSKHRKKVIHAAAIQPPIATHS